MKKLALVLLLLWPGCLLAQGIRFQSFTTNNGTIVTNIVKSLATNVVSQNAGSGSGIPTLNGAGTNLNIGFVGTSDKWIFTNPAALGYPSLWWTNEAAQASILFGTTASSGHHGAIRWTPAHPDELAFLSSLNFSFSANLSSSANPGMNHIGATPSAGVGYHDPWDMQRDSDADAGSPLGYGHPFFYSVNYFSGSQKFRYPGIMAQAIAANETGFGLSFWSGPTDALDNTPKFSAGSWITSVGLGNFWGQIGYQWNIRGSTIEAKTNVTISATPYDISLSSAKAVDLTLGVSAVTFTMSGDQPGTTNYQRNVVLIHSATLTPTLTWPSGLIVMGASAGGVLPTTMQPQQLLKVEIESLGLGYTNKLVTATLGGDVSFTWDQDALDFLGRASITDSTVSNAINNLVIAGKAHSWWTKCDVIYPMVGGNATAHGKNLKANTFNIVNAEWASGCAHTTANGSQGNGTTGFGNTGYTPSSSGTALTLNSTHVFVYVGTNNPNNSRFIGVSIVGTTRIGLFRNAVDAAQVYVDGINANYAGLLTGATSDFRGPMMATRTGVNAQSVAFRTVYSANDTTASASLPNQPIYILARYDSGAPGAGDFSNAPLRGASIGGGFTSSEWSTYRADWETFNLALSRQSP